jgi:hypothetical protein
MGLRGKARFTHPTKNNPNAHSPNRLAPPDFSPEGDTSLPVCVSHRTLATTQPFDILPMRKHPLQIMRNAISISFSKQMLDL